MYISMASSIDPAAEIMHILLTDSLALQPQPVQPSKISDGEIEHEGQPFRLLDLPKEIQLNVVEKHFEGSKLNFKANAEGTIVCKSVSSLELERSSKHLQGLCLKTRNEKIPKTLHFLMPVDMQVFILYLTSQPQFAWIRSHVEMIMFTQSRNSPHLPIGSCYVQVFRISYKYPLPAPNLAFPAVQL